MKKTRKDPEKKIRRNQIVSLIVFLIMLSTQIGNARDLQSNWDKAINWIKSQRIELSRKTTFKKKVTRQHGTNPRPGEPFGNFYTGGSGFDPDNFYSKESKK